MKNIDMITGLQNLLTEMREQNHDVSIAEVTIHMRSGYQIENIVSVTSNERQLEVRSDSGSGLRCHHVTPDEVAGYSHVQFN